MFALLVSELVCCDLLTAALQEVSEFACTCERYVGTQSGGMDQAISIMGMNGVAKLINFDPVSTRTVLSLCHSFRLQHWVCILLR